MLSQRRLPLCRSTRRTGQPVSAALDAASITDAFFGTPLKAAGTLGISFATFRAILYYQLQYILAAHISNNVPPNARVVEFGSGTGLSFNYYSATTQSIYAVDTAANPELLGTVGAQVGRAVTAQKVGSYAERLNVPSGSADAVVSITALSTCENVSAAVAEAARVLRPGAPLLFFEQGRAPGPLTEALGKSGEFNSVRFDDKWGSYPLAPHAIGIAIRNDAPPASEMGTKTGSRPSGKAFAKGREPPPNAKGFGDAAKRR